jgi:hypothetical protein
LSVGLAGSTLLAAGGVSLGADLPVAKLDDNDFVID